MSDSHRTTVSFDDEPLILVDENDNATGYRDKADCHTGHGTLHRAFSIFLFDDRGRVLLQQRSAIKPLWPLYWSNSCCSHPRRGETVEQATRRRLYEELGVEAPMEFLYKFIYQADFNDIGAEYELCHVYIGAAADPEVTVHPEEVEDWRWVEIDALSAAMAETPERFTPWFKLEWEALMRDHRARIEAHIAAVASA